MAISSEAEGPDVIRSDNVCIESLSIDLTRPMLDAAARSVTKLGDKIEECVKFHLQSITTIAN